MAAVLGGLGAALIWAVGSMFASRAARALGPQLTLAWVMLVGLIGLGLVLPFSHPPHLSGTSAVWLALGGAGNVAGLLLMYRALRLGQLGVVMPIVATEGGLAALISILAGQPVSVLAAAALVVTVIGVVMTSISPRPAERVPPAADVAGLPAAVATPRGHGDRPAAAWSTLAALSFGVSLFATGKAGAVLPTAWAVMPPRVVGVLAVTIPLGVRRRLRWAPGTGRLLVIAGICEVAGFFAYATGARHDIAVAAVLATLTGAFGAGLGRVFFGEHIRASQVAGVFVIFAGVATLTAITS